MVNYKNYKMRVIETRYKKLNYETEQITDIVRYAIQEKYSWFWGWSWVTGITCEVPRHAISNDGNHLSRNVFDDRDEYYGFYVLEDCIEYMKKRMKRWRENLDYDDVHRAEMRLRRKLEKKHRKELKTTRKVVCEMTLLDIANE